MKVQTVSYLLRDHTVFPTLPQTRGGPADRGAEQATTR